MLLQEVRPGAPDGGGRAARHVGQGPRRPQLRHVLLQHGQVQQQRPRVSQESVQVVIHTTKPQLEQY